MSKYDIIDEIESQPSCWQDAILQEPSVSSILPQLGEKVAVIGCGTSWFIAMAYAGIRENLGHGMTDAFCATELPTTRTYDRVVAICRSGTTTEVLRVLERCHFPTVALTACPNKEIRGAADSILDLSYADEHSVVQTRFASTALTLLREHERFVPNSLVEDARRALTLDVKGYRRFQQITFLGTHWTIGLAHEAALKCREAAQMWTESYPASDYRHGPISIAQKNRLVYSFGEVPIGLKEQVKCQRASFVRFANMDPQALLIHIQRIAVDHAISKNLDPDHPRFLQRSVIL